MTVFKLRSYSTKSELFNTCSEACGNPEILIKLFISLFIVKQLLMFFFPDFQCLIRFANIREFSKLQTFYGNYSGFMRIEQRKPGFSNSDVWPLTAVLNIVRKNAL